MTTEITTVHSSALSPGDLFRFVTAANMAWRPEWFEGLYLNLGDHDVLEMTTGYVFRLGSAEVQPAGSVQPNPQELADRDERVLLRVLAQSWRSPAPTAEQFARAAFHRLPRTWRQNRQTRYEAALSRLREQGLVSTTATYALTGAGVLKAIRLGIITL